MDIPPPLDALAALLAPRGERSETLTYAEAASALGLAGRLRIHRLTRALEALMEEDARARAPFRAALVISRARDGLPAPGFFVAATRLGRYAGPPRGLEAQTFHMLELARLSIAAAPLGKGPPSA
ncbi:MAG: hypothetical protein JJU40_10575 [Rhodobacteraceae bacterium]|nr:hypothetical protein [Paracoccaceae bacterium]